MKAVLNCIEGVLEVTAFNTPFRFKISKSDYVDDYWDTMEMGWNKQKIDLNLMWDAHLNDNPRLTLYWVNYFSDYQKFEANYSAYEDVEVELIGTYEDLPDFKR